jgi:cytochrome P460
LVCREFDDRDQRQPDDIILRECEEVADAEKGRPVSVSRRNRFRGDVHDFSVKDGSYVEGNKTAVTVIVKDAKKYATTGGWGFQVWAGGDPSKPLVPDATQACFACHTPQKAQDYTFSTYIR